MPDIFYAASLQGRQQAGFASPEGFGKGWRMPDSGVTAVSCREDNAPVPVALVPEHAVWGLWYGRQGWDPSRYPCFHPKPPETIHIDMEFAIPANNTEAYIRYQY